MSKQITNITQQLHDLAHKAGENAHAPYSLFKVGAAILDENGKNHACCNVENASYPLGQCAEAGAISAMIYAGSKHIEHILICSPNDDFCPPCGGCRQKIAEFANEHTQVHLSKQSGEIKSMQFFDLLPMRFGFEKSTE